MDLTVRQLKAVPIRMAASDFYEAVSRGTIDGGILPMAVVVDRNFGEVVKFSTIGQNFGSFVVNYVISEKRWMTFPPNVQKAMLEAGESVTMSACEIMDRDEESFFAKMESRGMTMVRLSPADDNKVKTLAESVALEWAKGMDGKGKPGTQILKAYQEALQKFR